MRGTTHGERVGPAFLVLGKTSDTQAANEYIFGRSLLLDPCMSKLVVTLCSKIARWPVHKLRPDSTAAHDLTHPVYSNFITTIVIITLRRDEVFLLC